MLLAFSVAPSGVPTEGSRPNDASVHDAVAAAVKIVRESGLPNQTDSMFTTIEGEWDEVFAAVKKCHEVLHEMGAPRITSSMRFGTRTDRAQSMEDKIRSVEEKLL